MTKTHTDSIVDTDIDEDVLLDCSHLSDVDLDYEYSDSILLSDNGVVDINGVKENVVEATSDTKQLEAAKSVRLTSDQKSQQTTSRSAYESRRLEQTTSEVKAEVKIKCDFETTVGHVLELEKKGDTFAETETRNLKNTGKIEDETGRFNYEVVTRVDKLLEETYNTLNIYKDKLDPSTRAKLLNLILALKELPHLYDSTYREKGRCARVADWLNNQTSQPEPELYGSSLQDPVQLRRKITESKPCVRTVILGKRKRNSEDFGNDDIDDALRSSSDTRRVFVQAGVSGKRRKVTYK